MIEEILDSEDGLYVKLNEVDGQNITALEYAIKNNSTEIVSLLMENKVKFNKEIKPMSNIHLISDDIKNIMFTQKLNAEFWPLMIKEYFILAVKDYEKWGKSLNFLLEQDILVDNVLIGWFIHTVVTYEYEVRNSDYDINSCHIIDMLNARYGNMFIKELEPYLNDSYYLSIVISSNRDKLMKYIIEKGANINSKSLINEETPLSTAIKKNNTGAIRVLLENGLDINIKKELGRNNIELLKNYEKANNISLELEKYIK